MKKFLIKEELPDGTLYWYLGNGNWSNKKEHAKIFKSKNIILKLIPFEGNVSLVEVK